MKSLAFTLKNKYYINDTHTHAHVCVHVNEDTGDKVAAMLLVFQGVPQLQMGGPVMQRDRFRSLTHWWDEYRRRRGQDGACWRGGILCGMKRERR